MLDGRKLTNGKIIETDVCIVGAGASGITLAIEFCNAPFNVVLVESGGLKFNHRTQLLYQGQNIGRPYFDVEFTKQRYFGGATNKWYGRCRPFDIIDFEKRPWVPYSGWPFGKDELDPFYARSHKICQIGPFNYDPKYWENGMKREFSLEGTGIETKIFQFSPPTRFGKQYLNTIESAKNIRTFLYANAVSIFLEPNGKKVASIKFRTLNGKGFKISAKIFILAASALENTRLLLVSNNIHKNGIGNHHDLVGRFFMEHPYIFCGVMDSALSQENASYYKVLNYNSSEDNHGVMGALGFAEDVMRREQMLNACAFFVWRKDYKVDDRYFSEGALSLIHVMDTLNHTNAPGLNFFQNIKTALQHSDKTLNIMIKRLRALVDHKNRVAIHTQIETAPNPDSRVSLSRKKDNLGVNKLALDWRLTQQDLDSFLKFQNILFNKLRTRGYAVRAFRHELDKTGWPVTMRSGKHHMGTTRMHADPKKGVVDPNCRVHGVANLYIAGGSVFPTSGQANPLLTIVALAIRLADFVKRII